MQDFQTQSFIITIRTDGAEEQDNIDWQAKIIHVLSGAQFAFDGNNQIEEIKAFIRPYLIELGINDPSTWLENNISIELDTR